MTLDEFRSRFPIFKRRVYVNSCSQGALSTDVEDAMRAYLDSWHESGSPWELWVEQVERLRARVRRSIGADRDEIAVMPSASAGINAVASALDFAGPRSHVVIGDFEFPTMAQVWLAQERRGATIRRARASSSSPDTLPLEAYDAVIDERTLIVPATHVCFRNGHRTDIAGLARAGARARRVCLSRRLPAHRLGPDRRPRARRRFHGHRLPEVSARRRRHRVPLRAARSDRALRADGHRLVRPRQSVRVPDRRARLAGRRQPVRERHAAGAERLRGARRASTCSTASATTRSASRSTAWSSATRQPRGEAGSSCGRRPQPDRRGPLVVVQSIDGPALVQARRARIIASCRGNGLRVASTPTTLRRMWTRW